MKYLTLAEIRAKAIALLLFISVILMTSCQTNEPENEGVRSEGNIAYISVADPSRYVEPFESLRLGVLFDFDLQLLDGKHSWVNLWVEHYIEGEKADPFVPTQLTYGFHPDEGPIDDTIGMGLIKVSSEEPLIFLYSRDTTIWPVNIDHLAGGIAATWKSAISSDKIGLSDGETLILAYYRKFDGAGRFFDVQDEAQLEEMLRESHSVLLLKLKVTLSEDEDMM